jgi:hypothetical protein
MAELKKDMLERRRAELKAEQSSFIGHYQELSKFIQPRRGRFFLSDVNKGDRRHQNIINSTATTAHRRCRAGIINGLMSSSRPHFKYTTPSDPGLAKFGPVEMWLYQVEQINQRIMRQSNLYPMAQTMVGEEILFGTGAMMHHDDFKDVARFYALTAGSYTIDLDARLMVNTVCNEFEWTVAQIVEEYGLENCSTQVKTAYDRGNYGTRYTVVHFIGPNSAYDSSSPYAKDKAFISCHYEPGGSDKTKFLRESGFKMFPGYFPRWDVTGNDIYGTDCPGMTALGDTKGLQLKEKRKAQGIDKMVNPPLKGPASLKHIAVSSLPGALTAYEGDANRDGLSALYTVNLPIQEMRQDIDGDERRIKEAFYNDLFRAISDLEGVQPQNEMYLSQVRQESLVELGPVIERFQGEFQDPLHDRLFDQGFAAGIYPPPPEELRGQEIKPEYTGPLAIAARAAVTQPIDRVAGYAANLMKMGFTDVKYKFDAAQSVDEYAKAVGAPATIIISDEDAAAAKDAEMQAQQAAMAAEGAQMATGAVKNMADAGAAMQQGAAR